MILFLNSKINQESTILENLRIIPTLFMLGTFSTFSICGLARQKRPAVAQTDKPMPDVGRDAPPSRLLGILRHILMVVAHLRKSYVSVLEMFFKKLVLAPSETGEEWSSSLQSKLPAY